MLTLEFSSIYCFLSLATGVGSRGFLEWQALLGQAVSLTPVTPHHTDLLVHEILLKHILLNKESIHYLTAKTMVVVFFWSVSHLQLSRNDKRT